MHNEMSHENEHWEGKNHSDKNLFIHFPFYFAFTHTNTHKSFLKGFRKRDFFEFFKDMNISFKYMHSFEKRLSIGSRK